MAAANVVPVAVATGHCEKRRSDPHGPAICVSGGACHSWYHRYRHNAATERFPTDFVTVIFANPVVTVPYLLALAGIKTVSEEKRHRSLLWSRITRDLNQDESSQRCDDENEDSEHGDGNRDTNADTDTGCGRHDRHGRHGWHGRRGAPHFWKFRAPPFPFNPDPAPFAGDTAIYRGKDFDDLPGHRRRHLLNTGFQKMDVHDYGGDVAGAHRASELWDAGITGAGIKVAVFDTGLRDGHPHFRNVEERLNWTDEPSLGDELGHGSFVAGIIASQMECLGFAPDARLFTHRVFTNQQVSFTSWFLDAFNYVIQSGVDVLNLSIGGPDFLDRPFVEKVRELSANGVIVVSAIGNDGPDWGTLNSPADQPDVIGVGGIDNSFRMANFASRGMTTWELPHGYGRAKPDVVTFSSGLRGSSRGRGCRRLGGTSVASPVVAGAVTLLVSSIAPTLRPCMVNPATLKQALVESAKPLRDLARSQVASIFEQGAGLMNLIGAHKILRAMQKGGVSHTKATLHPSKLDFTNCPYMWPYCMQPLYHSSAPVVANLTVLNGMGVTGRIVSIQWVQTAPPVVLGGGLGQENHLLTVRTEHSRVLWPWTGYVAVFLTVPASASAWSGIVEGEILVTVESDASPSRECAAGRSVAKASFKVQIAPTPPRSRRVLWDQFHNLRYPPTFIPRDDLDEQGDVLDWHADHAHTNFHEAFDALIHAGFFIEILTTDFTCFDANNYGVLLLIDSEEEYFAEEVAKLTTDVKQRGLSLVVFADWYDLDVVRDVSFFDENTRDWWDASTGGANVPALNDLLSPFGIALGGPVLSGTLRTRSLLGSALRLSLSLHGTSGPESVEVRSGNGLLKFPSGGRVARGRFLDQSSSFLGRGSRKVEKAILGITSTRVLHQNRPESSEKANAPAAPGRIAVFGDSNCVDSSHSKGHRNCFWLLKELVKYASSGTVSNILNQMTREVSDLDPLAAGAPELPLRRQQNDQLMKSSSKVVSPGARAEQSCHPKEGRGARRSGRD
jgi:membrane-bound transcription factor site-1 protease